MREPSPADVRHRLVAQAAAAFARIADHAGGRAGEVTQALADGRQACQTAAGDQAVDADTRQLFANLATAVEAWQSVWPRLGGQGEFRAAVIREAGQWARKLELLATQHVVR